MDPGNHYLLDFTEDLISEDRRQSHGLPPKFVWDFCYRVFTEEKGDIAFDQALAGLDYLRDLEDTRRSALRGAAQRLGITIENWRDILSQDTGAKLWVENIQALELEIEIYYAAIFIDLRIWVCFF